MTKSETMNITAATIRDLLPVCCAGDASEETVELVNLFLAQHPELREELVDAKEWTPPSGGPSLTSTAEHNALRRTKRMLHLRSLLMGFAILATALPFSFGSIDERGVRAFFWPEHKTEAMLILCAAAVLWLLYASVHRKLTVKGF